MVETALSISLCFAAYVALAILLRRNRLSLGLPIAYLTGLLLIHVPGAFAPLMSTQFQFNADVIALGIRFTAEGALCFVAGVWVARTLARPRQRVIYSYLPQREWWLFCLIGGLFVEFGLGFLSNLPSLQATVDKAGALWMLGALLGLRYAVSRSDLPGALLWCVVTMIYPVVVLLLGGFLSYGSAALIIVASALVVSVRNSFKLTFVGLLLAYLGMTAFVNYFAHRTEYRETAWSDSSLSARVDAAVALFSNFHWFDLTDVEQLSALDKRLNQNYFVGMAALRLQQEQVDYLYGRSIWEGVEALVPRALWPDKPVTGGSGHIVAEMTGLNLNEETSWGVGNVMEFQINFGTTGVVIGFLILGFLIGWLDCKAALADARGDQSKLVRFFLCGVALIQPNGSIVEIAGGAAAALVASYIWQWAWYFWLNRSRHRGLGREFAALR